MPTCGEDRDVLSIGAMGAGQGTYYVGLAREDYYLAGGEPLGLWAADGSRMLELIATVEREAFLRLFQGLHPETGTPLVQNAGDPDRQPGWDLTFSAPKSCSVEWGTADPTTRQAIQQAHFAAVKAALAYLEEECAFTRRGQAGAVVEKARLVVATFEHGTSRAQDPQLHTHALVLNVAVREDGTTGTLLSKPLYRAKMCAGALYRAALAEGLERLGYRIERQGNTFEIAGVPETVTVAFSQRRASIEAVLAQRGETGAKAAAVTALATREVKEHVAREELFARWREAAGELGFSPEETRAFCGAPPVRDLRTEMEEAVSRARERLSQQVSHFSTRDLLRFTAEEGQGRGVGADHARVAVEREIRFGGLIPLGVQHGEQRYTTPELFALEQALLADVDALRSFPCKAVAPATLEQAIQTVEVHDTEKARANDPEAELRRLSPEQRRAAAHLVQGEGGVAVVSGMAGTGKSCMLAAAREAWEAEGRRVIGAALSGKAARGLEESAGIRSSTLARLLSDLDGGDSPRTPRQRTRELSQAYLGKPVHSPPRLSLDKNTVLCIDEAGMVGTRMMAALVAACRKAGARLVLVGDARQLQAVEVGGPFQAIEARIGRVELTEIQRQELDWKDAHPAWRREAVHDFAAGQAAAALAAYAQRGLLEIAETRDEARKGLIAAWSEAGLQKPASHLILAATRQETRDLNRMAQAARRAAGKLGPRIVHLGGETLQERDRILFTRNDRGLGVQNGDLGTVVRLDLTARRMRVRLDDGRETEIPYERFPEMTLGYAVTTHKAQGASVDHAYVLCGGSMADREMSYVQASRARKETRFFTERQLVWDPQTEQRVDRTLPELARQMSQSRQKDLAHDVLTRSPRQEPVREPLREPVLELVPVF